jgi:Fe2+ or Zn2+ uptake regulation protein
MPDLSEDSTNENLEQLRSMIRDRGLKAARPRIEVIELLRREGQALSVKEVAELLSGQSIDQSSIFRALKDLRRVEILVSQQAEDGTDRYAVPK